MELLMTKNQLETIATHTVLEADQTATTLQHQGMQTEQLLALSKSLMDQNEQLINLLNNKELDKGRAGRTRLQKDTTRDMIKGLGNSLKGGKTPMYIPLPLLAAPPGLTSDVDLSPASVSTQSPMSNWVSDCDSPMSDGEMSMSAKSESVDFNVPIYVSCPLSPWSEKPWEKSPTLSKSVLQGQSTKGVSPGFAKKSVPKWSVGSLGHEDGLCKPCAWAHRPEGCSKGQDCEYCHECDSEAMKRKKAQMRAARNQQRAIEQRPWNNGGDTIFHERSVGSAGHEAGTCKPCAWIHRPEGCSKGKSCEFCHMCDKGAMKRKKAAQNMRKMKGLVL